MRTIDQLVCEKCGYRWFQRTERKPVKCPECQSRSWDRNEEAQVPENKDPKTFPLTTSSGNVTNRHGS